MQKSRNDAKLNDLLGMLQHSCTVEKSRHDRQLQNECRVADLENHRNGMQCHDPLGMLQHPCTVKKIRHDRQPQQECRVADLEKLKSTSELCTSCKTQ